MLMKMLVGDNAPIATVFSVCVTILLFSIHQNNQPQTKKSYCYQTIIEKIYYRLTVISCLSNLIPLFMVCNSPQNFTLCICGLFVTLLLSGYFGKEMELKLTRNTILAKVKRPFTSWKTIEISRPQYAAAKKIDTDNMSHPFIVSLASIKYPTALFFKEQKIVLPTRTAEEQEWLIGMINRYLSRTSSDKNKVC
jgi:hypothetical protein